MSLCLLSWWKGSDSWCGLWPHTQGQGLSQRAEWLPLPLDAVLSHMCCVGVYTCLHVCTYV